MSLIKSKVFFYHGGKQEVTIGDVFNWDGTGPGIYTVVGWGKSGIYSPSGLGGTHGVFIRDEKGFVEEWCGDSVASGVARGKIIDTTPQ
jgi:hypothetical protein